MSDTPTTDRYKYDSEFLEMLRSYEPENVVLRFEAAMAEMPRFVAPLGATEFGKPAVNINDFMHEVGGVLRNYGLLPIARLDRWNVVPLKSEERTYKQPDGTPGVVKSDICVVEFVFSMSIEDFAGNGLWPVEKWVTLHSNIDVDKRPTFWVAKALSYALKYWLARRLAIALDEPAEDDPDMKIAAPVQAAPAPPAPPPLSETTWNEMFVLYERVLGAEKAVEVWAQRKRSNDLMTVKQSDAAMDYLEQISPAAAEAAEEPQAEGDDDEG